MLSLDEIVEALGEVNFYYFYQRYGREPTALEAIDYYLRHRKPKVHTFEVVPNLFNSMPSQDEFVD